MKGASPGRMRAVRDRYVEEARRKGGARAFPLLVLDLDNRDAPFSAAPE